MDKMMLAVMAVGLVVSWAALFILIYMATQRGFRMLRAIQIAETAVDVAMRYGGNAGPVKAVRKRLLDLKWEVGIRDAAGVPPVAEGADEDDEEE
jgi:hypothetical protein